MAQRRSAKSKPDKRPSSSKSSSQRAKSPAEKGTRRRLAPEPVRDRGIIGDQVRRIIIAVICIICAIALMVIVLWPTNAVVTAFLSEALHACLGIGAYLLPLLLALIGLSFLVRIGMDRFSLRVLIGLVVMLVGILILVALFSPHAMDSRGASQAIFNYEDVVSHGGYIGAGPAYLLLMLLGFPVSIIISLGIIIVGIVIIGFAIMPLAMQAAEDRREQRRREEEALDVVPAPPVLPTDRYREVRSGEPKMDTAASEAKTRVIAQDEEPPRAAGDEPLPMVPLQTSASSRRRRPNDPSTRPMTRKLGEEGRASLDLPAIEPEAAPKPKEQDPSRTKKKAASKKEQARAQAMPEDDGAYHLPDPSLLRMSKSKGRSRAFENELQATAEDLQQTMEDFGINAQVVDWVAGPTVTLFEVDLPPGVRVSRLTALKDDIALALAAPGVRIFAPIPKTHYVGIEVPNTSRENVLLGDILKDVKGGPLEVAIGKDVEGNPIIEDLAKMPHLLIGGTTGSGKSVGINAMVMSILMRATPDEVRFIMIDPKRVEFAPYDNIPHLYVPVVTEPKEAASALAWGVAEMELRLKAFQRAGVRNITSYNEMVRSGRFRKAIDAGEKKESDFLQPQFIDAPMPYIVIVIDELADLMMNVGKEVEYSISRIAQLARAAGIHLIVATQRPSANVVTGLIKANITTRIAYNVASGLDSRVILDTTGAESLIGLGDLLISKPELGKPLRIQGCFTSDEEIASVVDYIKAQGEPEYHSEILKTNVISLGDSSPDGSGGSGGSDDPLIWEAADIVVSSGLGSTSNIQRKLKVGYARAGRIMDMLEEKGVVGPPNGSKPREVLVDAMELETLKAFESADPVE